MGTLGGSPNPPALGSVERSSLASDAIDGHGGSAKRQAYDWFVEGTRAELGGGEEGDARAETCYRAALGLDAGLAAARTNLGSLAYRRGDTAGAREAFEAALALDPDQPEARFNLANLVLENGDLELAVAGAAARAADGARLRGRSLQFGGRARAPRRPRRGSGPPRALPLARAGSDPLGRAGARAHRAARLDSRMARWLILAAIVATAARPTRSLSHDRPHERVLIPAGPFTEGSTHGEDDERPARKVTVRAFAMDRTEVTRAELRRVRRGGQM